MDIKQEITVTLKGEEVERLWVILKQRCTGTECVECTEYSMYNALKSIFDPKQ